MASLILASGLLATIIIPMITSRDSSAERGLRRTLLYFFLWNVLYLFAIRFIYPRL